MATYRLTRRRAEVMAQLTDTQQFLSVRELHYRLQHNGSTVGLTTVYRIVQTLCDAGEIDTVRLGSGEQRYRRCDNRRQHHHLTCRRCARAVEVDGLDMEPWVRRTAGLHGYTDVRHTVELTGICRECTGPAGD
ncbi:Fur family transcriptional regulator [Dactylosporangium sp. CA-139066]|uniref:Fur family transcriptional regulator n=1 Tax=Dactylosporangium sp. CA-139066 TaxID=3239930 RepID=UPI003D8B1FAF